MNKRKLIISIFGLLVILAVSTYFTSRVLLDPKNREIGYFIILVALFVYTKYSIKIIIDEINVYKLDKKDGLREEILQFTELKSFGVDSRYPTMPTCLATFKNFNNNEIICLSGDYSKVELIKGKKYRVSYFKHTQIQVKIEEYIKAN